MAEKNCAACADLQADAPNLIVNGIGTTEVASLQNNTGLNPASGNDDCTDLNNMNDCLIGNLEDELDAYDVCDWKSFTKNFVNNTWTVLKGIISAICGLWTNLTNIRNAIQNLQCQMNYLFSGQEIRIDEDESHGSYVVAGKGVSFLQPSAGEHASDIYLQYIAGGLMLSGGSCNFYKSNFTDGKACWNFDNGSTVNKSASRQGNQYWGEAGRVASAGELIYEIRIKKSQYPEIKRLFNGFGQETNGGGYHTNVLVFNEGQYAYGQHGRCETSTGNPSDPSYDRGHLVQSGWIYVQVRMSYVFSMNASGTQYSPRNFMGIRTSLNNIDC